MNDEFSAHLIAEEKRLTTIEKDISELKEDMKTLKSDIRDLLDAWNAAGSLGSFLKWAAGIAGGLAVIWNLLQHKL